MVPNKFLDFDNQGSVLGLKTKKNSSMHSLFKKAKRHRNLGVKVLDRL